MATVPERIFALPDLGEGLHEAEIVAWHVTEGEHVVADQPLVSVETDKAVVEIPSPRAGRIAQLLAAPHARLSIGAPLVAFTEGRDRDTGTLVGELTEAAPSGKPVAHPRATPAVRALAKSLGVDIEALKGTGVEGEITRADVERAGSSGSGMEPLRGMRRVMALRMTEAGRATVPATLTDEAVIVWPPDTSVTARLVAALVAGCRAEPALNAAYDGATIARRLNAQVHVGLAVDTENGLIVPVLHNAEQLGVGAIEDTLNRLTTEARTRRIAPEALRGATISLSNFGSLGGKFASHVVVPPQVATLGVGRVYPRVMLIDGKLVTMQMLPLSLTFDHRAVSGGEAARFLGAVKLALEAAS
jgi:2-oxoisovalerate dehydrogenase E2 component (dihydrolipoyl transacylase)